jgi:hypothetical protein
MDVSSVLALAFTVLAVGSAAFVLFSIFRRPEAATPLTDAQRLVDCERKLESLFALRAEWIAYQELIDDALETVELKRRRAAASASKKAPAGELAAMVAAAQAETAAAAPAGGVPQNEWNDRAALRRRAMAKGVL